MGATTGIAWAHSTWNLWRGCTKYSAGCDNCYAEAAAGQNPKVLGHWGPKGPRVVGAEAYWKQSAKWDAEARRGGVRKRVFVNAFADFFEQYDGAMVDTKGRRLYEDGTNEWLTQEEIGQPGRLMLPALTMDDVRLRALEAIANCPHLDFLLLTKRAEHILGTLQGLAADPRESLGRQVCRNWLAGDYPPNVWLGVSVEDQQQAWLRIERLKEVPAACRWLSVEPMLGRVDLRPWLCPNRERDRGYSFYSHVDTCAWNCYYSCGGVASTPDPFHWVVIGGESDNNGKDVARDCHLEWVRYLTRQCQAHRVPVFVKQLGSSPVRSMDLNDHPDDIHLPMRVDDPAQLLRLQLRNRKGEDMAEWPADLRLHQFPCVEE